MRICSLLPSATEIAFALGLGDEVVGVTHECDYPAAARQKRVLVRSPVNPSRMTSLEIDSWVSERLRNKQTLYTLDEERLREAAPDIILTQGLCDVCALDYEDVVRSAEALPKKPKVVSLTPSSLTDVLADIARVGEAAGRGKDAERLCQNLSRRISAVRGRAAPLNGRPRVACLEWFDPIFTAGHWVPEMVDLAGGSDCLGQPGAPSAKIEWPTVVESRPDIVVLMPCGFDTQRAATEARILKERAGWRDLPAVKTGRVYAVNGSAYFSRPGPRLVDGLEILANIIHPETFPPANFSESVLRLS
jgi:iron complex transport system substrate-binding protein